MVRVLDRFVTASMRFYLPLLMLAWAAAVFLLTDLVEAWLR